MNSIKRFTNILYAKSAGLNLTLMVGQIRVTLFVIIAIRRWGKMKMIGISLGEDLIGKMKAYVQTIKQFRSYTLGELVRESVEKYLKEKEDDGKN